MTTAPTVPFTMSGTLLGFIDDNGHLPATFTEVTDTDPDRRLHRATAWWYMTATRVRAGSGWRYTGPATAADIATILDYLESYAGALECSPDPDARADARAIRRGMETTIRNLRQAGAAVTPVRRGLLVDYTVEVFDGAAAGGA